MFDNRIIMRLGSLLFIVAVLYVAFMGSPGCSTSAVGPMPHLNNDTILFLVIYLVLAAIGARSWRKRKAPRTEDRTRYAVRRAALPPTPTPTTNEVNGRRWRPLQPTTRTQFTDDDGRPD